MAQGLFNVAKGRVVEFYNRVKGNDPAGARFVYILYRTNVPGGQGPVTEAAMQDADTIAAVTALGVSPSHLEANFITGSYTRILVNDTDIAALPAPDDVNDRRDLVLPRPIWFGGGGGGGWNDLSWLIIAYDQTLTGDGNIVPCQYHSFVIRTDGNDLGLDFGSNIFLRSS